MSPRAARRAAAAAAATLVAWAGATRADEIPGPATTDRPAAPPPPPAAPPPGTYPPPGPPPAGWAPYPPGYYAPGPYAIPLAAPPPTPYRYQEGTPVPPGYKIEERPIKGLVIAGSIVLGTAYFLGLMIAADDDFPNKSGYLLVPALGPWLTLATRDDHCSRDTPEDERIACVGDFFIGFALVIDGAIQTGGAAMLLAGLLAERKYVVPDDSAPRAGRGTFLSDLRLRPALSPRTRGLSVEGRF